MANEGPRACDFEPVFTQELAMILMGRGREEFQGNIEEPELDLRQEQHRLNNVNLCQCTNCGIMPSITECRCCHEINNIDALRACEACITNYEDFDTVCLNKAVLRAVLIMRNDVKGHDANVERELDSKSYRYSAYRMFRYWVHGRLGKGVKKVVPSCAVRKIRQNSQIPKDSMWGLSMEMMVRIWK
ncbi:hypothetical protein HOLleu_00200 [Holothuria leucospilota]|uniref:P2X purinoreceptor 7 intracellular domain-containing protein n=1 Tax=Holothuria leucospilota TaxID=206669 RepID=A0A9Q1CMK3_HOLLE|nr:hypothetical protein HOLleu_00200 [Holothuria leucospilota]